MSFRLKPAHREQTKLLIGLCGPTGSGKSLSALYLASGIVAETGGKIAYVDTENGRALQYAPPDAPGIEFGHGALQPPFSPARYLDAYEAAERYAGPNGVVVIDSVSHEHEGPGGVLEMHDAEVDRRGERMQFAAWAKPKAERRKLINRILQSRCHVILAFRAKEKSKQVKVMRDGKEKSEIVSIGWQPITGDEWAYESTIFALLNPEAKGFPIFDDFSMGKLPLNMRDLIPTDRPLDVETGRRLAQWAQSGKRPAPRQSEAAPELETVRIQVGPNSFLDLSHDEAFEELKSRLMENRGRRKALDLLTQKNFGAMAKMSGEQRGELERIYNDAVAELERQEELV